MNDTKLLPIIIINLVYEDQAVDDTVYNTETCRYANGRYLFSVYINVHFRHMNKHTAFACYTKLYQFFSRSILVYWL